MFAFDQSDASNCLPRPSASPKQRDLSHVTFYLWLKRFSRLRKKTTQVQKC
jgi:hypothetical protein